MEEGGWRFTDISTKISRMDFPLNTKKSNNKPEPSGISKDK
jgi:hypothetical protein